MRFSGKAVFITGASRGIGYAIAKAFRSEGAHVIGTYTGGERDDSSICDEWFIADFSKRVEVDNCASRLMEIAPDILINNAGVNKIAPFEEIPPDDFLFIQQINVFAPFRLCQAAIPAMKKQNWGRIVNLSSIWGKISKAQRASYSASKFALDGLTIALSAEHASNGIIANSIAPGFFDTELTRTILGEDGIRQLVDGVPAHRLGQVDEIARFVLWLCSDENTYVSGQNLAIDGGFTRV